MQKETSKLYFLKLNSGKIHIRQKKKLGPSFPMICAGSSSVFLKVCDKLINNSDSITLCSSFVQEELKDSKETSQLVRCISFMFSYDNILNCVGEYFARV